MNIFKINGIVTLALCVIIASDVMILETGSSSFLVMDQDQPSPRCKYSKAYSLLQVDCSSRSLSEIPAKLNTDIEVMVMTSNRLRELPKESFAPYKSLAYLYLSDNFISEMNDSVEHLQYLQVLDLSTNGILVLPSTIFQLPYLRKLYLTNNKLKDDTFVFEITSPLEYLEVAKNYLTKIPYIGSQAELTNLNLSSNKINHISTDDVAPFCSLKMLDLTNNPIKFDQSTCDCHQFNSWIGLRNLKVKPNFFCNNDTFQSCSKIGFSNETIDSFEKCLGIIELHQAREKARSTWIIIASCITVFMICVIIGLCCVHKRNKKRNEELKNEQRLAANNANTELLNGNLTEPEAGKS